MNTRHSSLLSAVFGFSKILYFLLPAYSLIRLSELLLSSMVMGLCLLVYNLGQRALRQALERAKTTIDNQLGKPTSTPTISWVFQCFMSIHLVTIAP